MSDNRRERVFLTAAFLVLIAGAGLVQVAADLSQRRTPRAAEIFACVPTSANLKVFEMDLQDNCWLAQRLRPYVQYAQFMALRELGDKAVVGEDGWLFYKPAVQYLVEPWPPFLSPGDTEADEQGDVISAVISFRDQLAERGIRLLVVPAPNKSSVYPDMLTRQAGKNDEPVNSKTIEIMRRLREAQVEVVDLFSLFKQAREASAGEATKYYLARDSHWSPQGVQLAAKAVARKLTDLGWAEKKQAEYSLKSVTIERPGDILKMAQVPQVERQFEPERIDCAQVISRMSAQPYQNDPNSEILVLGDSFLRIYSQDEPGAAGFVEHLAYELGFSVAAIVNDGGASTLVRQQLSRNPRLLANKKAVVWEFVERDIRFGTEGWQIVPLR